MRLRYTLYILAALVAGTASDARAGHTLTFDGSEAATIGVQVTRIDDNKDIAAQNISMAMTPASILKCVTSAAAITTLGADFTFGTPVYLQGEVVDGTLRGNIVIRGVGDPTIDDGHFKAHPGFVRSLTDAMLAAGVRTVTGDIIIDDNDMPDQGQSPQWLIEDTGWDYGAGYYAFNYGGNIFRLNLTTMSTSPQVPDIEVIKRYTDSTTDMLRGVNSDLLIVTGRNVNTRNHTVTTSMDNPSASAIIAIHKAFGSAGINVVGDEERTGSSETLLMTYRSPKATDILGDMMRRSDNLMAEAMLRALAPGRDRDAALAAERNALARLGLSLNHARIVDGSGLARTDRVTPQLMTDLLRAMARNEYSDTYVSFFPKAGREGTVKRILKGTRLEGKVVLKSGSMNGVHCYAGYCLDDDGMPTHTIVIMVNNFFCSRDKVRSAIERFLLDVL